MAAQCALEDVTVRVYESWQECYIWEQNNIGMSNICGRKKMRYMRCDRIDAAVIRNGDEHVGLQTIWRINIIWREIFHRDSSPIVKSIIIYFPESIINISHRKDNR
jgi:hypothetical protein